MSVSPKVVSTTRVIDTWRNGCNLSKIRLQQCTLIHGNHCYWDFEGVQGNIILRSHNSWFTRLVVDNNGGGGSSILRISGLQNESDALNQFTFTVK